jgi:hypothetical protein
LEASGTGLGAPQRLVQPSVLRASVAGEDQQGLERLRCHGRSFPPKAVPDDGQGNAPQLPPLAEEMEVGHTKVCCSHTCESIVGAERILILEAGREEHE